MIFKYFYIPLRKLLILLLMLTLPLQGYAGAIAPLHLALNPAATAAMPCHDQASTHGTAHDAKSNDHASAPSNDVPREADVANHLCCHQVFTCTPTSALATPAHKFGDVPRFVLPLATLYIPDSPYRPPRG